MGLISGFHNGTQWILGAPGPHALYTPLPQARTGVQEPLETEQVGLGATVGSASHQEPGTHCLL